MNPFQSDNIWKKKARQGKAQQHPLTPRQEWQKQVNSSSLWLLSAPAPWRWTQAPSC